MLSVHGIIAIMSEPEERQTKTGTFFRFKSVSADTKTGVRHYYNTSIFVGERDLEQARRELKLKKVVQITHGSWDAKEYIKEDKTLIGNNLNLNWNNIAILGWFANRQETQS